jgi:hypothetical protein
MRKLMLLALSAALTLPVMAANKAFNNVPVVDVKCSQKASADPDSHTRSCLLMCQASGFGIVTEGHQFIRFDKEGNARVLEALKNSQKKDHLRVDVSGDVESDTLKVKTIKLL